MALLFASAAGANVFVTSGSDEKLRKAKELGAKDGVNYKDKDWGKKLKTILPKDRPYLDAVIDGAGGDIVNQTMRVLKAS
jgi:NADPH:quinone reductase-like Zn-dependent oxidoreductase